LAFKLKLNTGMSKSRSFARVVVYFKGRNFRGRNNC